LTRLPYLALSGKPEDCDPCRDPVIVTCRVPETLPATLNLSDAEKKQAERFVREGDSRSYAFRHHVLRTLLSKWLHQTPDSLTFSSNPFGKPFIEDCRVHFNISRSGTFLCLYFGPHDGGVDIERRRDPATYRDVAARHFHPDELKMLKDDDDFFVIWTRKEALLKATGTGLSSGLHHFDCSREQVISNGHTYHLRTYLTRESVLSICLPVPLPELKLFEPEPVHLHN